MICYYNASSLKKGSKSNIPSRGVYFVMIMEYYGVCIPLLADNGHNRVHICDPWYLIDRDVSQGPGLIIPLQ